jgi:hypothetical protein
MFGAEYVGQALGAAHARQVRVVPVVAGQDVVGKPRKA